MSHDLTLAENVVTCSCGEFSADITDEKFYEAVAQRHLLSLGLWPFSDSTSGWSSDEKE